ncbi:MAG TPA: hypothetical protein PLQ13_02130 [Candidatus Krumholzibacteria bacterium]|nr:hypothetical protein [Candidatus Krumholzibacteria bacterium]
MFFTIYITLVSAVVLVGCLVAILMSTTSGARWLQSLWPGRTAEAAAPEDDGRPGP